MLTRAGVQVDRGATGDLSAHDLVAFAVPAEQLPAALERHGAAIPERAGVLVLSREMVPPEHARPSEYVAGRTAAWAVGVARGAQAALDGTGPLVLAAADTAFRRQVGDALTSAGFAVTATRDVAGVETGIDAPVLRDLAARHDKVHAA